MRALVLVLLLTLPLSQGGCAHFDSDKILSVAGDIKSAAERLARFQLSLAAALAEQGERDHCVEIAKVALWTLSSVPHKLATIAAEIGIIDTPGPEPVVPIAEAYCDAHREPSVVPPVAAPAVPSVWVLR